MTLTEDELEVLIRYFTLVAEIAEDLVATEEILAGLVNGGVDTSTKASG